MLSHAAETEAKVMRDRISAFFEFERYGTTFRREFLAGITTFVTMAYIVAVNPAILKAAGIPEGASMTATIATAIFGTMLMAPVANRLDGRRASARAESQLRRWNRPLPQFHGAQ